MFNELDQPSSSCLADWKLVSFLAFEPQHVCLPATMNQSSWLVSGLFWGLERILSTSVTVAWYCHCTHVYPRVFLFFFFFTLKVGICCTEVQLFIFSLTDDSPTGCYVNLSLYTFDGINRWYTLFCLC